MKSSIFKPGNKVFLLSPFINRYNKLHLRVLIHVLRYWFIILVFPISVFVAAQSVCPPNIGVEDGTFSHWQCFAGQIDEFGDIDLTAVSPVSERHTIWGHQYPPLLDRYGNFPVLCPNGSQHSIQLGNSTAGRGAERITYTVHVPPDKNEFNVIYHYAVVFQDAGHSAYQQPRFTVKVLDNAAATYISCGAFEYVASSNISGFKESAVMANVFYKPWTPVTLKISNCAGKIITLEFTTNDCTLGGHFGYAYIDIDENCASPITGNVYCNGDTELSLVAPFGFQEYKWWNQNFTQGFGTSNILALSPPPPPGTIYAVELIPYPGFGCRDTVYTTIRKSDENLIFNLKPTVTTCEGDAIDLTDSILTSGSSPNLTFSYYTNYDRTLYVPTPNYIKDPGIYYVKATSDSGCTSSKSIEVITVHNSFRINSPPTICAPNTIDLTDASIIAGTEPGFSYSYYADWGTTPLANAKAITTSGIYYIKAQAAYCTSIKPVIVEIRQASGLKTFPLQSCNAADLTVKGSTRGTEAGFTLSYWKDVAATDMIIDPKAIAHTGTYYIKGTDNNSCSVTLPIDITILPLPGFSVQDPTPVKYPATISLIGTLNSAQSGLKFTYTSDAAQRNVLADAEHITRSGTYYITAKDPNGCSATKPVHVIIDPPPPLLFTVPNSFSPNNDGVNDVLNISCKGYFGSFLFQVFDRWGRPVFSTHDLYKLWDGSDNGRYLSTGVYYWVINARESFAGMAVKTAGYVYLVR
jgi:gliding motility-associated-like protein